MKIDFDAPILDADGQTLKQSPDGPDALLSSVAVQALFAVLPGDDKLAPQKKADIGALGLKLHSGGEQELTVENIALIKERVARMFAPLVVTRAWALLDPVAPASS
jgi:hypothetical protein